MTTELDAIERSMDKTYEWLGGLAAELGGDRRQAYRVLRTVLQLLRDRMPAEEGAHLAAQLPHFLRGVFYEGWRPSAPQQTYRTRDELLTRVAHDAQLAGPTEASLAVEAVATLLRRHVSAGEIEDVLSSLPEGVRRLLTPA